MSSGVSTTRGNDGAEEADPAQCGDVEAVVFAAVEQRTVDTAGDRLHGVEVAARGVRRQSRSQTFFVTVCGDQKPVNIAISCAHRDTMSDMQNSASTGSSDLAEVSALSAGELAVVVRSQAEKIAALEHHLEWFRR